MVRALLAFACTVKNLDGLLVAVNYATTQAVPTKASPLVSSIHEPAAQSTQKPCQRQTHQITKMSTSSTAGSGTLHLSLAPDLNTISHAARVSAYMGDGYLAKGIAQLHLEHGDRFMTLVSAVTIDWKRGVTDIARRAAHSQDKETPFGRETSSGGEKEANVLLDVGNMIRLVVDHYKVDHPQDIEDEPARQQHLRIASAVFLQGLFALYSQTEDAVSQALFSPAFSSFASHKIKDAENAKLRDQIRAMAREIKTMEGIEESLACQVEVFKTEIEQLKFATEEMNELEPEQDGVEQSEIGSIKAIVQRRDNPMPKRSRGKKNVARVVKDMKERLAAAEAGEKKAKEDLEHEKSRVKELEELLAVAKIRAAVADT
jgi:hypothetical protein